MVVSVRSSSSVPCHEWIECYISIYIYIGINWRRKGEMKSWNTHLLEGRKGEWRNHVGQRHENAHKSLECTRARRHWCIQETTHTVTREKYLSEGGLQNNQQMQGCQYNLCQMEQTTDFSRRRGGTQKTGEEDKTRGRHEYQGEPIEKKNIPR